MPLLLLLQTAEFAIFATLTSNLEALSSALYLVCCYGIITLHCVKENTSEYMTSSKGESVSTVSATP